MPFSKYPRDPCPGTSVMALAISQSMPSDFAEIVGGSQDKMDLQRYISLHNQWLLKVMKLVFHRKIAGLEVSIGAGGLRFKKRPSGFNMCIAHVMEGQPGSVHGGRYDREFQSRFAAAARSCAAGKVKEKVLEEMGEAAIPEQIPADEAPGQAELTGPQSA